MTEQQMLVDERTLVSTNPATLEELGRVPVTQPAELDAICVEAAAAQRRWAARPVRERAHLAGRAADWILHNHARVAELITRENGKTIVEASLMEIVPVLDAFRYVERFAAKILAPERIASPQLFFKHKRHSLVRPPIGVVGIISPWNYPFSIPSTETAIALAAGNAVVLKPAPQTPLVAELLKEAFEAAGLPPGLLTVVHGDAALGQAMCASEKIGKIFFTGSVEVGIKVGVACAQVLKPFVLELGGKDAAIVCADADLDRAARGILWGGAANCGQTCAGIERVYVDRSVHDAFVDRITAMAERLRPGNPLDPGTQVGPFTLPDQYDTVVRHVDGATAAGATKLSGGPADVGLPGRWYAPAVVTGVDHSMALMREETFGPVVPIMPFDGDDEAVALANDSEFGLGGSVWTRDARRGRLIARRLDAGSVWINDHMYSYAAAQLPWGGVKRSGIGVTHSKLGFYECTQTRMIAVDSGRIPMPFWYPYDERLAKAIPALLRGLYGPHKVRALLGAREDVKILFDRARRMSRSDW